MALTRTIMTSLWLATGLFGCIKQLKRNRVTECIYDILYLVSYTAASFLALKYLTGY
jgi:hypothetical protein